MAQQEPSEFPRDFKGNAYVAIFQDREFVEEFVAYFVELGDLAPSLNFEGAERLDRVYITERLREPELLRGGTLVHAVLLLGRAMLKRRVKDSFPHVLEALSGAERGKELARLGHLQGRRAA